MLNTKMLSRFFVSKSVFFKPSPDSDVQDSELVKYQIIQHQPQKTLNVWIIFYCQYLSSNIVESKEDEKAEIIVNIHWK